MFKLEVSNSIPTSNILGSLLKKMSLSLLNQIFIFDEVLKPKRSEKERKREMIRDMKGKAIFFS